MGFMPIFSIWPKIPVFNIYYLKCINREKSVPKSRIYEYYKFSLKKYFFEKLVIVCTLQTQ